MSDDLHIFTLFVKNLASKKVSSATEHVISIMLMIRAIFIILDRFLIYEFHVLGYLGLFLEENALETYLP